MIDNSGSIIDNSRSIIDNSSSMLDNYRSIGAKASLSSLVRCLWARRGA